MQCKGWIVSSIVCFFLSNSVLSQTTNEIPSAPAEQNCIKESPIKIQITAIRFYKDIQLKKKMKADPNRDYSVDGINKSAIEILKTKKIDLDPKELLIKKLKENDAEFVDINGDYQITIDSAMTSFLWIWYEVHVRIIITHEKVPKEFIMKKDFWITVSSEDLQELVEGSADEIVKKVMETIKMFKEKESITPQKSSKNPP